MNTILGWRKICTDTDTCEIYSESERGTVGGILIIELIDQGENKWLLQQREKAKAAEGGGEIFFMREVRGGERGRKNERERNCLGGRSLWKGW